VPPFSSAPIKEEVKVKGPSNVPTVVKPSDNLQSENSNNIARSRQNSKLTEESIKKKHPSPAQFPNEIGSTTEAVSPPVFE
jgi:hypothetical protein